MRFLVDRDIFPAANWPLSWNVRSLHVVPMSFIVSQYKRSVKSKGEISRIVIKL